MFGWFAPKCSLDLVQKAWVEYRWRWLGETLGWDSLLKAKLVRPEDIPGAEKSRFDESDADQIFGFIADSMSIDRERVCLRIWPDDQMPEGTVGQFVLRGTSDDHSDDPSKSYIHLRQSELLDPESCVSSLAHELAHEVLLGGGLQDPDSSDLEWTTDLLTAFLGYGVFNANSALRDQSYSDGPMSVFEISRRGYMPAHVFGHALALFAWLRAESNPEWIDLLRLDARKQLKQSLNFFQKKGDVLVTPEDISKSHGRRQVEPELPIEEISPTHRLGKLWELAGRYPEYPRTIRTAMRLLQDKEPGIRAAALNVIDGLSELPDEAIEALTDVLMSGDPNEALHAALILSWNGVATPVAYEAIVHLLKDHGRDVASLAAYVMGQLAINTDLPEDHTEFSLKVATVAEKALQSGDDEAACNLHPVLKRIDGFPGIVESEFSTWSDERIADLIRFWNSAPNG